MNHLEKFKGAEMYVCFHAERLLDLHIIKRRTGSIKPALSAGQFGPSARLVVPSLSRAPGEHRDLIGRQGLSAWHQDQASDKQRKGLLSLVYS